MYMGGAQTTPRATYAPARIAEPPITTRTPSEAVKCRAGKVFLSTKDRPDEECCRAGKSSRTPRRNPSRMPCFTQALTRQPVGELGSGEAERSCPDSRAARSERKAGMASGSEMAADPAAKWRSIDA